MRKIILAQSGRTPARPQNSASSAAATGKNTGESILCSNGALRGEAQPRSARLSHPRTPRSRLRAIRRTVSKPAGHPGRLGRRPAIRGSRLNQSTGYPISFANTRLPRFTGSRSFHSRNFAAPHRAVQTGTGIQARRGYVRFCAWRYRRSRRRDDCGRGCAPAHPTAISIRHAIFRAAGAAVQPAGMAGYGSRLPEVDGAAP